MLFRLLKNVNNWVFKGFEGIAEAEDRFVKSMFKEEIDSESD
jgi:hypothetical protein